MDSAELQDIRWLVENADRELGVLGLPDEPLRLASFLRARHGPNRTHLLCELKQLRHRARAKFSAASKMFFTRLGYEQSSDELIADYKARRFHGCPLVGDLCCGIGGDAIALGRVTGNLTLVDRSDISVELARANLLVNGIEKFETRVADVTSFDLRAFSAWHLDPDRRIGGRRRSWADGCEPPLDAFLRMPRRSPHGAVKLSPAADVAHLLSEGVELEWIGHDRECQQLVAWFGALAQHPGKRTATWLTRNDRSFRAATIVETPRAAGTLVQDLPRFVYEPRPSVLAAGLESTLAAEFGLQRFAAGVAYLGSNQSVESDLFQRFESLALFPYRAKTLRRKLTQLGGRIAEVKTRRVHESPERLLAKYQASDGEPLVLMLFPIKRSIHAILARRHG